MKAWQFFTNFSNSFFRDFQSVFFLFLDFHSFLLVATNFFREIWKTNPEWERYKKYHRELMAWNEIRWGYIKSNATYIFFFLCRAHKDIECFAFFCTFSLDVIVNWSIQSLKEKLKKEIEKIDSPIHQKMNYICICFSHTLTKTITLENSPSQTPPMHF